jgi:hypothetical protein
MIRMCAPGFGPRVWSAIQWCEHRVLQPLTGLAFVHEVQIGRQVELSTYGGRKEKTH